MTTVEEIIGRVWDCTWAPVPERLRKAWSLAPATEAAMLLALIRIAQRHGCTIEELRGPNRARRLVNARREVAIELHDKHQLSTPVIGRLLHRDHTTVLNYLGVLSPRRPRA